jgi:hypothetical protein
MRQMVAMALLGFLIPVPLWAQNAPEKNARAAVAGLRGVQVIVESITPDIERAGLTRDTLQTDVELQLRQYGIPVLTEEQRLETPGYPYLYVNVNIIRNTELLVYAFSIELTLEQDVILTRHPQTAIPAATWNSGSVGLVGGARVQSIRDGVKNHVNKFINLYLSANPKAGR